MASLLEDERAHCGKAEGVPDEADVSAARSELSRKLNADAGASTEQSSTARQQQLEQLEYRILNCFKFPKFGVLFMQ